MCYDAIKEQDRSVYYDYCTSLIYSCMYIVETYCNLASSIL